jgi:hypothetical protein
MPHGSRLSSAISLAVYFPRVFKTELELTMVTTPDGLLALLSYCRQSRGRACC